MLGSPLLSEAADLLQEYLKFMDDHFREAADLTFLAYRHRNYSKVIEFVQFKERLQHSYQYLMAKLEASILQLKQKADNIEEVECVLESLSYGTQLLELSNEEKLKSLTFNEDLQARPWWSPSPDVNYLSEPFEVQSSCLRENSRPKLTNKKEGDIRKTIERKSLLPRLVYLSMQTASSSMKEIIGPNGSAADASISQELEHLLEKYAKNIGHRFEDAKTSILETAKGQKSSKDFGSDIIDWVNFAIFVNAWNTHSHCSDLLYGKKCNPSSWQIVDSIIKTCVAEQLMCAQPVLTSPGSNFPVLAQLVTESFSWHILVIQSCVRSIIPQGKKKKKGIYTDHSNLPQVQALRTSIDCLTNAIQEICRWLKDQINLSEDQNLDALLSHVQKRDHEEGPGRVLQILENNASANNCELGERISRVLQSWSSANVIRKLVGAQSSLLSKFELICRSKLKLLESLKHSI
ncbi:uncharacterized protein A4U43_C07F7050 [Asparagus officinalis]|uniref:Uncharacterized protein n=2 Tax=Asparagus officinalis TaxID=4686 RepID=A0A5P1EF61_ASPOF|nr:uncharacterized protein A4U43_C07F7050 [Asparagus officinalis]